MKNIGLKIVSVLIALAMWFFVISKGQSDVLMEVPVEFRNIPHGLEVIREESTVKVSLNIRGRDRFITNLTSDEVHVYIDLGKIAEGTHTLSLKWYNIKVPFPLEVVSTNPANLRVKIERAEAELKGE